MEMVEGKPLSELIPRGGLPLPTLLQWRSRSADAMAAAQQRGITHRDLKPANVMMTPEGRVKVLDFGIAKLRDPELAASADDPTRPTHQLTGEGRIIGTVAYMSPEQAEGKPVDPRSDIFALGVLLLRDGDRRSPVQRRYERLDHLVDSQGHTGAGHGPESRPSRRSRADCPAVSREGSRRGAIKARVTSAPSSRI